MSQEGVNRNTLATAGFDAQGRCAEPLEPLADLPRWRLEQLLDSGIRDASYYRSALTHPTALPTELRLVSYERLEYLGDAVLELCTRQMLMQRTPEADEGELTKQGQYLVAGHKVNTYGAWLGLDKWVCCNAYSMRDGLTGSPHILGDAFEALLGAVYLDRGLEAARKVVLRVMHECPSVQWEELEASKDFKGMLARHAQWRKVSWPQYVVKSSRQKVYGTGGLRRKYWNIEVLVGGEVLGEGKAFEKKMAERLAAREALINLGVLPSEEDEVAEEATEGATPQDDY